MSIYETKIYSDQLTLFCSIRLLLPRRLLSTRGDLFLLMNLITAMIYSIKIMHDAKKTPNAKYLAKPLS